MGNQLEKQYGLKQDPIKLPGSYSFLKYADHPSDKSSSLIIIKSPHKAGVIYSDVVLPIKDIKNLNSDFSVATTSRCKPLGLVKPRSQAELKLIMSQLIKLSTQMGRIFLCDGKLMQWCEQIQNLYHKSPQQIETGKKSDKSKVFVAGLSLVNFLHCLYQKEPIKKKKQKNKNEIQSFFNPKDKKQYSQFIKNMEYKISKSTFWPQVSEGMKKLILIMLAPDPSDRIDIRALKELQYFTEDRQLKLYTMLVEEFQKYDEKDTIIFMETLQLVIKDRIIFDDLILEEYLVPMLLTFLSKKPEFILSCLIELSNPPISNIYTCLKKANPQNIRLLSVALSKKEKIYSILDQDEYDASMSRTAFCSFQSQILLQKLLKVIPYLLSTIKEQNYKKQIEFQLITNVLESQLTSPKMLLGALKCLINLLSSHLLSNINKLFNLKYDPRRFQDNLEINLHILEVYRLIILQIQPQELISIMMPKLNPYLSNTELTDEIFFMAKRCMNLIMKRLHQVREINMQDDAQIQYEQQFFQPINIQKPSEQQIIQVLQKQVHKSKNPNIQWLACILQKQKYLTEL